MILNVFTVISAFLALVGLVLAILVGVIAARGCLALRRHPRSSQPDTVEDRAHLLGLLVAVLTGVRFFAWPHFYFLLKSYVPDLAAFGVMCVYGVTRIQPEMVTTLQVTKPLLMLGVGLWWLLGVADRRSETHALLGTRFAWVLPVASLAAFDCVVEAMYLVVEKVGQPVTCCTQFLDTQTAGVSANVSPLAVAGFGSSVVTVTVYLVLNVLLIAGAVYLNRCGGGHGLRLPGRVFPQRSEPLRAFIGKGCVWVGLALIPLANLVVTRWAWLDTVAPRVLQLPYHHCIYELITDIPALSFAAVMALLGNGCLLWPLALQLWQGRAPDEIADLQRSVYGLGAVALATELLIVGVHIA